MVFFKEERNSDEYKIIDWSTKRLSAKLDEAIPSLNRLRAESSASESSDDDGIILDDAIKIVSTVDDGYATERVRRQNQKYKAMPGSDDSSEIKVLKDKAQKDISTLQKFVDGIKNMPGATAKAVTGIINSVIEALRGVYKACSTFISSLYKGKGKEKNDDEMPDLEPNPHDSRHSVGK